MDILAYEFTNAPSDSYNGILGTLVRELRFYRNEIESTALLDEIQRFRQIESVLQKIDEDFGNEQREYINEILAALDREQDVIHDFEEEINTTCTAVLRSLFNVEFSIDQCSYELVRAEHVLVCQLDSISIDISIEMKQVVVETFRAVCYKKGVVFINN